MLTQTEISLIKIFVKNKKQFSVGSYRILSRRQNHFHDEEKVRFNAFFLTASQTGLSGFCRVDGAASAILVLPALTAGPTPTEWGVVRTVRVQSGITVGQRRYSCTGPVGHDGGIYS